MKKQNILLAVAIIATGFSTNAQIQKGNILIGGNLANINVGLNDPNILSADITPKAAWFIQDNIALGGYVNFGIETAKNSGTTTNYGIGALGRYYMGKEVEVIKHSRFFGELTAGFGGVNVSDADNTNGLNIGVGPGFAYFITPNIGLEVLVKYNSLVGLGSTPYQDNLNASFGFQIYLPGKSAANKVRDDRK
jgi:outer membrane protein assembly factor BamA